VARRASAAMKYAVLFLALVLPIGAGWRKTRYRRGGG
jgi:hypothetical protein